MLHDRYSVAKHAFATVRALHPGLPKPVLDALQEAIDELSAMDGRVESYLQDQSGEPPSTAELNISISGQLDTVNDIEIALRKEIGQQTHG